jgi:hypothetical protein
LLYLDKQLWRSSYVLIPAACNVHHLRGYFRRLSMPTASAARSASERADRWLAEI